MNLLMLCHKNLVVILVLSSASVLSLIKGVGLCCCQNSGWSGTCFNIDVERSKDVKCPLYIKRSNIFKNVNE